MVFDSAEQKSLNKELQQYWKLSAKVKAHTVAVVLGHEKRPDLRKIIRKELAMDFPLLLMSLMRST